MVEIDSFSYRGACQAESADDKRTDGDVVDDSFTSDSNTGGNGTEKTGSIIQQYCVIACSAAGQFSVPLHWYATNAVSFSVSGLALSGCGGVDIPSATGDVSLSDLSLYSTSFGATSLTTRVFTMARVVLKTGRLGPADPYYSYSHGMAGEEYAMAHLRVSATVNGTVTGVLMDGVRQARVEVYTSPWAFEGDFSVTDCVFIGEGGNATEPIVSRVPDTLPSRASLLAFYDAPGTEATTVTMTNVTFSRVGSTDGNFAAAPLLLTARSSDPNQFRVRLVNVSFFECGSSWDVSGALAVRATITRTPIDAEKYHGVSVFGSVFDRCAGHRAGALLMAEATLRCERCVFDANNVVGSGVSPSSSSSSSSTFTASSSSDSTYSSDGISGMRTSVGGMFGDAGSALACLVVNSRHVDGIALSLIDSVLSSGTLDSRRPVFDPTLPGETSAPLLSLTRKSSLVLSLCFITSRELTPFLAMDQQSSAEVSGCRIALESGCGAVALVETSLVFDTCDVVVQGTLGTAQGIAGIGLLRVNVSMAETGDARAPLISLLQSATANLSDSWLSLGTGSLVSWIADSRIHLTRLTVIGDTKRTSSSVGFWALVNSAPSSSSSSSSYHSSSSYLGNELPASNNAGESLESLGPSFECTVTDSTFHLRKEASDGASVGLASLYLDPASLFTISRVVVYLEGAGLGAKYRKGSGVVTLQSTPTGSANVTDLAVVALERGTAVVSITGGGTTINVDGCTIAAADKDDDDSLLLASCADASSPMTPSAVSGRSFPQSAHGGILSDDCGFSQSTLIDTGILSNLTVLPFSHRDTSSATGEFAGNDPATRDDDDNNNLQPVGPLSCGWSWAEASDTRDASGIIVSRRLLLVVPGNSNSDESKYTDRSKYGRKGDDAGHGEVPKYGRTESQNRNGPRVAIAVPGFAGSVAVRAFPWVPSAALGKRTDIGVTGENVYNTDENVYYHNDNVGIEIALSGDDGWTDIGKGGVVERAVPPSPLTSRLAETERIWVAELSIPGNAGGGQQADLAPVPTAVEVSFTPVLPSFSASIVDAGADLEFFGAIRVPLIFKGESCTVTVALRTSDGRPFPARSQVSTGIVLSVMARDGSDETASSSASDFPPLSSLRTLSRVLPRESKLPPEADADSICGSEERVSRGESLLSFTFAPSVTGELFFALGTVGDLERENDGNSNSGESESGRESGLFDGLFEALFGSWSGKGDDGGSLHGSSATKGDKGSGSDNGSVDNGSVDNGSVDNGSVDNGSSRSRSHRQRKSARVLSIGGGPLATAVVLRQRSLPKIVLYLIGASVVLLGILLLVVPPCAVHRWRTNRDRKRLQRSLERLEGVSGATVAQKGFITTHSTTMVPVVIAVKRIDGSSTAQRLGGKDGETTLPWQKGDGVLTLCCESPGEWHESLVTTTCLSPEDIQNMNPYLRLVRGAANKGKGGSNPTQYINNPLCDFAWHPLVGPGIANPSPGELSRARRCYGTFVFPLLLRAMERMGSDVSHAMPTRVKGKNSAPSFTGGAGEGRPSEEEEVTLRLHIDRSSLDLSAWCCPSHSRTGKIFRPYEIFDIHPSLKRAMAPLGNLPALIRGDFDTSYSNDSSNDDGNLPGDIEISDSNDHGGDLPGGDFDTSDGIDGGNTQRRKNKGINGRFSDIVSRFRRSLGLGTHGNDNDSQGSSDPRFVPLLTSKEREGDGNRAGDAASGADVSQNSSKNAENRNKTARKGGVEVVVVGSDDDILGVEIPCHTSLPPNSPFGSVVSLVRARLNLTQDPIYGRLSLSRLRVVSNPRLERSFLARHDVLRISHRRSLLATRGGEASANIEAIREAVGARGAQLLRLGLGNDAGDSCVTLAWHGTPTLSRISSILRCGFLSLATLNLGWFGRGVYLTSFAQYAAYYATKGFSDGVGPVTAFRELALVCAWVQVGKCYPVLGRMDGGGENGALDESAFHGGYPGSDSHYALVGPGGQVVDWMGRIGDVTQHPIDKEAIASMHAFDEFVINNEAQMLPWAVAFLTGGGVAK